MLRAVSAKYQQYADLAEELLATEGPIVAAPSTSNWQQLNSIVLELVRDELRVRGALLLIRGAPGWEAGCDGG